MIPGLLLTGMDTLPDAAVVAVAAVATLATAMLRIGAHDADRTRDLSLTKGVLYH
jgi:hypothetical protein